MWGWMLPVENKDTCLEEDLKSSHRNEEFTPASNTSAISGKHWPRSFQRDCTLQHAFRLQKSKKTGDMPSPERK